MSGSNTKSDFSEGSLARLEAILDRRETINSLDALIVAVSSKTRAEKKIDSIAIGFDSSVFLRLGSHKKITDIMDYFDGQFNGPLILPGQAVQEFWNNQLAAVETVAASLKKKFEALKLDAHKVDGDFGGVSEKMGALFDDFASEYGYIYDESTIRTTLKLLELLKKKAIVSYVPRMRFYNMALQRKRTKTPPGFKDDADGDFYIWLDFLYGLLCAHEKGQKFQRAILITNDVKVDWSRGGIAHPVLCAEVKGLVGADFDVWTTEELNSAISQELEKA